jgi:dTMP kinase
MWVVIEGSDGQGKSTIVKELQKRIKNVKTFYDPGISNRPEHAKWQDIRNFIKQQDMASNSETLMFLALRCELVANIKQAVKEGHIPLVDRYNISTHIYQGVLKGQTKLIEKLESAIEFPKPDYTFVLSAPWEVVNERIKQRFETVSANMDKFKASEDFRYKIWSEYDKYIRTHSNVTKIDTNRPISEIADELERYIIV